MVCPHWRGSQNLKHAVADLPGLLLFIPAYGQPWLTCETLHTALNQIADFNYSIVIVNDGCPTTETHDVCQTFASGFPERVFYLSKNNGGLSSARNCGIAFALAAFSQLEAVYFLDCDNRIGPRLFLSASPECTALVRPASRMGISGCSPVRFCRTCGYIRSPIRHWSICFAIFARRAAWLRADMLDAGIRFDTEMRQGVEDWEFWLQGMEKGFRGVHVGDTGFAYRRRGESMLVAAERDFDSIKRYIRHRHPRLFNPRNVLTLGGAMHRSPLRSVSSRQRQCELLHCC